MNKIYLDYTLDVLTRLLNIDSPTGYTNQAAEFCMAELTSLGYEPVKTAKGGVLCAMGDSGDGEGLLLSAHIDTIGAIVREVKGNGRLKMINIGGASANNLETETVKVYARDGKAYDGTIQLANASAHVNGSYNSTSRTFDSIEVVLDEDISSSADVRALGIGNGCFICPCPRVKIMDSGYIKSRYLDDKLCAAILIGMAKQWKEEGIVSPRPVYLQFSVYEEVGHGASATMPAGVTEILSLDMGCVGDGMLCTEKEVSICARDASGPYNYDMVTKMIDLSEKHGLGYQVDVYTNYSSDSSVAVKAHDVRHAIIGPGVYASHGYERSHVDGVANTYKLAMAYALGE